MTAFGFRPWGLLVDDKMADNETRQTAYEGIEAERPAAGARGTPEPSDDLPARGNPSIDEPPAGEPPIEEPPGEGPPGDQPPGDEPPVEEPPADDPTEDAPVEEPYEPPPAGDPGLPPPVEEPGDIPPVHRVADPQLKAIIEALIFASPEPLTPKMLFKLLESEPKEDVQLALESLRADYDRVGGLQLVEIANGYQIVTRPEMHEWVRRLFHERKTQKLSVQALETLAVIAYKQPITAPEVSEIRGVNTGGVINTLLERHLIKISGRKAVVGRPFLYSTTREFLIRFGLKDLGDLPKVEDMADVLGFEPPAGLADAGPSDGRLPLEGADADGPGTAADEGVERAPGDVERVH